MGYFPLPEDYYDAIIRWQQRRNGVQGLAREHIGYENGVLGGVSTAIQMLTAPGEELLLHAPTYVGFTHVLKNIGRVAVHSELKPDENGIWRMDYEDMDRKLREHHIHVAIFCSPHNPCGRVWERWEIEKAMEVYAENDCLVISDEIWSDIILPGHKHIPTQSVSADARERTLAFYAPSKTFSLAGPGGLLPHRLQRRPARPAAQRRQGGSPTTTAPTCSPCTRLIGAYRDSEDWCDEMIRGGGRRTCDYACAFIAQELPRRKGHALRGHLHALSRLRRLVPRTRGDHPESCCAAARRSASSGRTARTFSGRTPSA